MTPQQMNHFMMCNNRFDLTFALIFQKLMIRQEIEPYFLWRLFILKNKALPNRKSKN